MVRAGFLLLFAAFAGATAWGALSNLWADYQDSPTSTYLLIGLPALALCLAALLAAAASLRRR
jgi:uncharacterized membrane protein YjjB (DUF3815 family)